MKGIKNLLVEQRFGRLFVVSKAPKKEGRRDLMYECLCVCGKTIVTAGERLVSGKTASCGCLNIEKLVARVKTHGAAINNKKVNAETGYNCWENLKQRCYNKNHYHYKNYGGRGIKVSERWLGKNGFKNFITDIGPRPSLKHTVDRFPNMNGDYEPDNCRWATPKEQMSNIRTNVWLESNGEKLIIAEWARRLNISTSTIYYHYNMGHDISYIQALHAKRRA